MCAAPFPDHLRAEYDPQLLDAPGRRAKAVQLQRTLAAAGVWQSPSRILDVGTGSGLILAALDAPRSQRVGCDVRRELYETAGAQGEIDFVQADSARLPFESGRFELVLCLAVIEEFADWRGALAEMARCVASGGWLYVTVTNGPLLVRRYALQEKFGRRVPKSSWEYARVCLPMYRVPAREGMGVDVLRGWGYIDVTPHLLRAAMKRMRLIPRPALNAVIPWFVPSYAHAWQHP